MVLFFSVACRLAISTPAFRARSIWGMQDLPPGQPFSEVSPWTVLELEMRYFFPGLHGFRGSVGVLYGSSVYGSGHLFLRGAPNCLIKQTVE